MNQNLAQLSAALYAITDNREMTFNDAAVKAQWPAWQLARGRRTYQLPDVFPQSLAVDEWTDLIQWFDSQFSLFTQDQPYLTPTIQEFFAQDFPSIALSAMAAKYQLGNPKLGLLPGSSRLRPQMIRPVTVFASGGTSIETWLQTAGAAGWNSSVWTIDTSITSTTKNINTQNNVALLILGIFEEEGAPLLQEYQWFDSSGASAGVESLALLYALNNLNLYRLAQPLYVGANSRVTFDLNYSQTGNTIPGVFGVQFARPQYATAE
jgi:hypothetical protein